VGPFLKKRGKNNTRNRYICIAIREKREGNFKAGTNQSWEKIPEKVIKRTPAAEAPDSRGAI